MSMLRSLFRFPKQPPAIGIIENKPESKEEGAKYILLQDFANPAHPNRLFKEKITVEKARANLVKILDEIKDSPHSIYTQLDFRGTERLDLKYLKESISEALKSEKRFHKLESGIIFLLALVLLTPAFRAFIASMFALPACFNATDVLPPKEMFEMGWEVGKWPSLIFAFLGGGACGVGYHLDKSDEQLLLQKYQRNLNRASGTYQKALSLLDGESKENKFAPANPDEHVIDIKAVVNAR